MHFFIRLTRAISLKPSQLNDSLRLRQTRSPLPKVSALSKHLVRETRETRSRTQKLEQETMRSSEKSV